MALRELIMYFSQDSLKSDQGNWDWNVCITKETVLFFERSDFPQALYPSKWAYISLLGFGSTCWRIRQQQAIISLPFFI